MKFLLFLITFLSASFVTSFSTNFLDVIKSLSTCSPYDENEAEHGVIIRPVTPVYLIHYPDKNVKPRMLLRVLEISSSYDFYNKAKLLPDALVLSILVTVDYNLYKTHGENIINHVLSYWNNVNKIMEELDNPKIKIILRGIAIPTEPDVFDLVIENNEDNPRKYYPMATVDRMEEWWKENYDRFEGLPDTDIDVFIFQTSFPLVDSNYNNLTGSINLFDCKHSSFDDGINVAVVLDTGFSEMAAARLIAQGFGVENDEFLGCNTDFIMSTSTVYKNSLKLPHWSECSRKSFQKIAKNESYSCFKMTKNHFYYSEYDD
ncbi:GSCOCG00005584001-RA-CDS [Cotesia congregata]|uniref:Peptidase M12B domain-containing protein n=1 Tax=Cotesia congregata TaxID=51543 RepID=A0A8J2HIS3_COTCN|nr:GSCOCG00005584001-RA-CDS [Cotesia congregata]CAG5099599.1 Protein of unknown function [Cotesia congregata]